MTAEAKWIVDSWAQELQSVLQFLTGDEWTSQVSPVQVGSSPAGYFWWTQGFKLTQEANIWIGAPALAWSELGARVLQAAGVDLIEQATAKSTYLEAMLQSINGLGRVLSDKLSRTVEPTAGRDEAPSEGGIAFDAVLITGGFDLPAFRFVVSEQMCAALAETPKAVQRVTEAVPVLSTAQLSSSAGASGSNVSVLLDVQMPVSICFGRASMPLREVMKLTTGSAVALDRRPDDEVDVIVNNCVIAKGEVVVIDGNYGVRVTGIISREQRMALRAGVRS